MRTKHTLWRVSNGWLLVPDDCDSMVQSKDASGCAVFKSLKEFADYKPARVRKPRSKPSTKETSDAN